MRVRPMSISPLIVRQGTTPGSFLPTDLPGLAAWYDASRITGLSDGEAVAQWDDLSGNGHHLTQATSEFRPLYKTSVLNGLPALLFDGADDRMDTADDVLALSQPLTIGIVLINRNAFDFFETVFDSATAADRATSWVQSGTLEYRLFAGSDSGTTHIAALDTPYILQWAFDGASSEVRRNGEVSSGFDPGSQGLPELRLGANHNLGAVFFDGHILEAWLVSGHLSTSNQALLENYANAKYGIF